MWIQGFKNQLNNIFKQLQLQPLEDPAPDIGPSKPFLTTLAEAQLDTKDTCRL